MHKITLFICLCLLAVVSAAHAYSVLDQAKAKITLAAPWKTTSTEKTASQTATIYSKLSPDGKPEGLAEIIIQKSQGKTPIGQIQEMNLRIETELIAAGCKSSGLTQLQQKDDKFSAWIETFQCSNSELSLVQLFIDADARNMYLLTYTNTVYPFTDAARKTAYDFLKSVVQVCYADKKCYSLQ